MEKPKPVYLVLLGIAVVVLVYMTVIKGGGDSGESSQQTTTQTETQAPTKTAPPDTPTKTKPTPSPTPAPDSSPDSSTQISIPKDVATAMLDRKVVVVLLWSPRGATDRKVKKSIDRLKKSVPKSSVSVFTDSSKRVSDYSFIASDVRQSPAVLIVDRNFNVKAFQGYVDYTSILQAVREARRTKPS